MKYKGFTICGAPERKKYEYQYRDILKPLDSFLDQCWWYIGYTGNYSRPDSDEVESKKWDEAYDRLIIEPNNYRVAKPGFWSFAGSGIEPEAIYYVIQADDMPMDTLDKVHQTGGWFDDPNEWSLPEDVCLILRDIDAAYCDVFVNRQWMYDALDQYFKTKANLDTSIWEPKEWINWTEDQWREHLNKDHK